MESAAEASKPALREFPEIRSPVRTLTKTSPLAGARAPTEPDGLLRQWRDARGKSQLELSLDIGIRGDTSVSSRADAARRVDRR